MKCPSRRWWLVLAVGGILFLVFALRQQILPLVAKWLDVGGLPQKADAVVLLNGSLNTRPFTAAALVYGGWAPKAILNSVAERPNQASGAVPPFFEINLKVLDYGGLRRDQIVCLDSKVTTTFDEAKAVAEYLVDHPARRLLIVTEGPHSRRARWIFQRFLAGQPVEIVMVSGPSDGFDNDNWWQCGDGFLYVLSEYFKLFFYGVRYGWLGYEIVALVAVLICLGTWFLRRRKLIHGGVAGGAAL